MTDSVALKTLSNNEINHFAKLDFMAEPRGIKRGRNNITNNTIQKAFKDAINNLIKPILPMATVTPALEVGAAPSTLHPLPLCKGRRT